jgi:hypothetical protein
MSTMIEGLELVDNFVEFFIDEYGMERTRDSREVSARSADIIGQLEGKLGSFDITRTEGHSSGRGTSYGGLDSIFQDIHYLWPAIAGAGGSGVILKLVREWLSLKKTREVVVKTREDGTIKEIRLVAPSSKELEILRNKLRAEEELEDKLWQLTACQPALQSRGAGSEMPFVTRGST